MVRTVWRVCTIKTETSSECFADDVRKNVSRYEYRIRENIMQLAYEQCDCSSLLSNVSPAKISAAQSRKISARPHRGDDPTGEVGGSGQRPPRRFSPLSERWERESCRGSDRRSRCDLNNFSKLFSAIKKNHRLTCKLMNSKLLSTICPRNIVHLKGFVVGIST